MSAPQAKPTDPLEALASEADSMTEDTPLGEGVTDADVAAHAGQVVPVQSNAELLAGAIGLVRDTVTQLAGVRSIQHTLNPDVVAHLGQVWGAVCDRYGIRLQAYMGNHAELIAATLTTLAIGRSVLVEYRAEQAAKAKATPEPTPAPPPPEGAEQ